MQIQMAYEEWEIDSICLKKRTWNRFIYKTNRWSAKTIKI